MGPFWDSWELWEKMCFVLACAIVLTVIIGICKLTYDSWRLRKFTRIAQKHVEEGSPPPMQQKRRGRADSDVPFGVRAIESGIEVEGVWISRGNSPATSAPSSPPAAAQDFASARSTRNASRTSIPTITMPKPVHSYSSQASSVTHSPPGSPGRSAESSRRTSRNVSPTGHHRETSRPSYKPRQSSHLRYSSGFYGLENANDGDEEAHSGAPSRSERSPSGSSSDSSESTHSQHLPQHYRPRRQPSYTSVSPPPSTDARRSEIDLMPFRSQSGVGVDLNHLTSHRRSQAAEMGQLMPPRSRTSSSEWGSSKSVSRHSVVEEGEEPSMPEPVARASDPFQAAERFSKGSQEAGAPSFQSFLETDPTHSARSSTEKPSDSQTATPRNPTPPTIRIGSFDFEFPATDSSSQSSLIASLDATNVNDEEPRSAKN